MTTRDAKVWHCGHCPLTVDIPPEYPTTPYIDALMWIREHRFAHLVSALEKASDEELMGMSGDEPEPTDPVQTEDVGPVLAGVTELLKADLPRAQRVWYDTNEDGTFKSADELAALYEGAGVTKDKPTIAYCRIGERSSHTWFVLKYLLGYPEVRNYDGSWTEWGSMVGQPIEK